MPLTGLESEAGAEAVAMTTIGGRSKSRRSRFRNDGAGSAAGKKVGKGKGRGTAGGLKTKAEILKKRSIKQVQERRRKMKRKSATTKGQSTNRRKGHRK